MAKLSSTQIYGDLQVDGEIKNKATIETEGVVQLNDAIDNTSVTQGATANAVKKVNDSLSSHKTDTTSHITASERTTWNEKLDKSGGKITGSLAVSGGTFTAPSIGVDTTMNIIPQVGSEVNFGGTNTSSTIYMGYRASGSKPIPSIFVFGGGQGSSLLKANRFQSTVATGTSPLIVDSTTVVSSLNADMLDGNHAWQMQTLSSSGSPHGSSSWVAQIQHNKDGDGLFKLFVGDQSIGTKVDKSIDADTLKKRDICTEIDNLKSTVVNGKTSVANAINGKLGTSLSNQSSFDEMATAISNISKAPEAFSMGSATITGTSPHPLGKYVESCFSMQTGKNGTVRIRLIPNQTSFNSLGIHVSSGTYSNIIFNQLIPNIALKDGFYEIEARFSGFVQMNLSCVYVSDTGKGITFSYCVFCD